VGPDGAIVGGVYDPLNYSAFAAASLLRLVQPVDFQAFFAESRMANEGVNSGRRRFITASTAVVGGVGAIFAAVPFVKSWKPSAQAQLAGAPVSEDISRLEPGQRLTTSWRGQPVWIIRRTPEQLGALAGLDGKLRDPASQDSEQQPGYAQNPHRSIKPEILVLVGICTHLGCAPLFAPQLEPQPFDNEWKGGFFCPCHGSKFDMAGRVYSGVPAPSNLKVPPYRFDDDGRITIGLDQQGAA
jgi:ubiquinol-cytochrome c reductase iron-sulfur subunit